MMKYLLTLAAICLSFTVLEADPVVTQFTTSNRGYETRVACDDDNNAIAVFSDNGRIKASYLIDGGAWGTITTLDSNADNAYPCIAMDATGTAIAMWGAFSVSPAEVRTAYFSGGVWSTPTPQPLASPSSINAIDVSMDGSGNGLGVWANANSIRASFFSSGTWGTITNLGSSNSSNLIKASYSSGGKASVVFYNTFNSPSFNIAAATYDGSVWAALVNLDSNPTGGPDAGIDANGNTIAIWASGTGVNNIVSRRFNGTSWSTAVTISVATNNNTRPQIAVHSDGTAIAVWADSGSNLQMAKFNGATWGTPTAIASGLAVSTDKSYGITMNANGDALIAWVATGNVVTNALLPKNGALQTPVAITTSPSVVNFVDVALSSNFGFDTWIQGLEVANSFGSSNEFITNIPPTPIPSAYDCYPFKSATGELLVAEDDLIAPLKFAYNTNTYSAITETTGAGTVTYDFGLALLESPNTGTAKIASGIRGFADPGQGVSCVFAASFYEIDAGSSTIAGLGNDTDGFFFSLDEATFGIVHRNNSVDTFIPQASWNVDTMDGNGPSGEVLDHTQGNVYKIQYMRLEFGNINFYIESKNTGKFILVNQIQYTNNNTVPSLTNPGMQLMAQVISSGAASYMELSSMGLYTEGYANPQLGIRNNVTGLNNLNTDLLCTLSIRNDLVFSSITSQLMVFPDQMSLLNTSNSGVDVIFSLYLNPSFDSPLTFTQVNPNSCVSYSTDTTTFTGGSFIGSFGLSSGSSKSIRLQDYGIELSPGDVLMIAGSALTNTAGIRNSLSWLEQF